MATWIGWKQPRRDAATPACCGRRCAPSSCSGSITAKTAAKTTAETMAKTTAEGRRGRRPAGNPAQARPGRDLGLCAGRRLPRHHQAPAQGRGALADGAGRRRREGLRRHRRGDGEAACRRRRPGLAGQAHEPGLAPIRIVAVPGRDLHHARAAAGRTGSGSLRQLPRLPRCLPDGGVSRTLSTRCAPLHLLSHHRAQGTDPPRTARRNRQPHLRLRRLPGGVPVEQVRASRPRDEAGGT